MTESNLTRVRLSNGLLVLIKEIHNLPLVSHWVWYRVGSRNETPGFTGASHWVEHMQFKGTPQHPPGVLDRAISRVGGVWNAFTFLDWTTYFETLPADQIELALQLEADRMVNSKFNTSDVEAERTVIIAERQGSENEPLFRLGEAVQETAFSVHAYRHKVIGAMEDLQAMTCDQLKAHYRSYYVPNNAVLALAGDIETSALLERLQELYKAIPEGEVPASQIPSEPTQSRENRINLEGPGETAFVQLAFHAPQVTHIDFYAYVVLDSLLAGASSLNLFGGGISNKTSRLYHALVERDLAVSVAGGLQATIDPFLHFITVVVHPQSSPEKVIAAIDREILRIQEKVPSEEEMVRAIKQARALFAYGSESVTNQAYWLGLSEMFATYHWFEGFLDRLSMVVPADVQRVAQQYLLTQNRTLGVYHPTGNGQVELT
jgi:zinc protease